MPYAIIENNKVVNIVLDVDSKDLTENLNKYIDYKNGWDYSSNIDGGNFFPKPTIQEI